MERIGFVGLGVMGAPMAGHVFRAGLDLTVWNRTPEKALPLGEEGVHIADTLGDLARACSTICLCVTRTEDVENCVASILEVARPDTLIIDHSTISPPAAERLHREIRLRGCRFVDAPITGGSMGAKNATLTVFCGGEPEDVERAAPILRCYAKRAERVGGPGAGQRMKMANQIAVGGSLLALCESLAYASRAGLDLAQTRELLSGGAAASWAFDNYGPKILARDWTPGFSIRNQRKDFGYCLEAAEQVGVTLPGTELVDRLLAAMEAQGHGEWTTAALFESMLESKG